jgi:hypothetical protein
VNLVVFSSVRELNSSKRVEPRKQLNKKFDHLVLGPAAGQGLSNRLQCQGSFCLYIKYLFKLWSNS